MSSSRQRGRIHEAQTDGYIAARGDDIGWSLPSPELHRWFNDRAREIGCLAAPGGHAHPAPVGGGTPLFRALDNWMSLRLVETRTSPDRKTNSPPGNTSRDESMVG